jgi:hypothetical protein
VVVKADRAEPLVVMKLKFATEIAWAAENAISVLIEKAGPPRPQVKNHGGNV